MQRHRRPSKRTVTARSELPPTDAYVPLSVRRLLKLGGADHGPKSPHFPLPYTLSRMARATRLGHKLSHPSSRSHKPLCFVVGVFCLLRTLPPTCDVRGSSLLSKPLDPPGGVRVLIYSTPLLPQARWRLRPTLSPPPTRPLAYSAVCGLKLVKKEMGEKEWARCALASKVDPTGGTMIRRTGSSSEKDSLPLSQAAAVVSMSVAPNGSLGPPAGWAQHEAAPEARGQRWGGKCFRGQTTGSGLRQGCAGRVERAVTVGSASAPGWQDRLPQAPCDGGTHLP